MEQYEHMKGPHNAVGLKFHLHRQGAVPLMEDFGENVPVGMHTFVGVSIRNVSHIWFPLDLPTPPLSISSLSFSATLFAIISLSLFLSIYICLTLSLFVCLSVCFPACLSLYISPHSSLDICVSMCFCAYTC